MKVRIFLSSLLIGCGSIGEDNPNGTVRKEDPEPSPAAHPLLRPYV